MRFSDLPVHDATLCSIHVSYESRRCELELRLVGSDVHVLLFDGFSELRVPRREPWGSSCSVNAARQAAPQVYELELQSGDVVRVEAPSWKFAKTSQRPLGA